MLIITGTYPPEKCGVGDYVFQLLHTKEGSSWNLYYSQDWSLMSLRKKIKEIKSSQDNLINIQYPSVGFGFSLVPHLLCLYFGLFTKKQVVVTLHEYTQMGWKGKLFMILVFISANKVIFTNIFERVAAIKKFPFVRKKSTIIKIYSNIPKSAIIKPIREKEFDIGYFGYIRPLKGLETFLDVVADLRKKSSNLSIYIMGQTQPIYESYYKTIIDKAVDLDVKLLLNKDMDEVANILANTKIAYLPYPDGVSERRGSFLAVIRNGCLVVTTKGKYTTKAHEKICFFSSRYDVCDSICDLLAKDELFYREQNSLVESFLLEEVPNSWSQVAQQYNEYLK